MLNQSEHFKNHPRYQEWCDEIKAAAHVSVKRPSDLTEDFPSFFAWLKLKEDHEARERDLPKIRGHNPPPELQQEADRRQRQYQNVNAVEYMLMAVTAIVGFAVARTGQFLPLLFAAIPIAVLYFAWPHSQRKRLRALAPMQMEAIPLNAYNTEFLIPLADYSAVAVTVHFQVPHYLGSPSIEQLNRVAENFLIRLCIPLTLPPSTGEIQTYLETSLVQFQDENRIPVLRLNVPLAVHKHPDKPTSVHV